MSSRKQFFALRYPDDTFIYDDEFGNEFQIAGMILQNASRTHELFLYMPGSGLNSFEQRTKHSFELNVREAIRYLKALDNPEIFELDETGVVKAIHRKCTRQIGAAIQWQIYQRDGFKCMYCGVSGGEAVLSVDHFIPISRGGTDFKNNLISSCTKCNKRKGSILPKDFLNEDHLMTLNEYFEYLGKDGF